MLQAMRKNTRIIMLVVVVAFVGLMVFQWGMDISGSSSPLTIGEVGSVNSTGISYQVWTATYRNLSAQAREQKGSTLDDLELDQVGEQAWNQLVNQILIDQELRRRGIEVTNEEIRLAFRTSPPPWLESNELFHTDGQFDPEKYQQFFSGPAVDPGLLLQIEQYYRDVLPRARLFEQISSGIYTSDSELWDLYNNRTEQARVKYFVIDPETQVEDRDVTISEESLLEYYRRNREDFEQPATAIVKLATFSRLPGPADTARTLETAIRIRSEILAGADFGEQAVQYSDDQQSASAGGDLGWFGRGDMLREFEETVFALEPGEISEPVLTRLGYHLIKLQEREEDRADASHILLRIGLGGESENDLFATLDRLERIALRSGLDVAVDSVGTTARQVSLARGTDFVPSIGRFGPVHDWAFHDSTFVDELSPVYETSGGFYVFELVERLPEVVLPFEEAEPSVRRRVLLEKKKETAEWLAQQIKAELEAGEVMEVVAASHGLEVQTSNPFTHLSFVAGLGQANAVIGNAFGLSVGDVAGPIEADNRFYFIEVIERVEADREAFEAARERMRAQLTVQRRQAALDEWLADIREAARIDDFRREIFIPRS